MKIKIIIGAFLLSLFTSTVADDQPIFDSEEHQCLAVAIYKEAGGESNHGKIAVGNVVLNRVAEPNFPDTVCAVVKQRTKYTCQFSWFCKVPVERVHIKNHRVIEIARELLQNKHRDNTFGSLFFHNRSFEGWQGLVKTTEIGNHIFYKKRGRNANRTRSSNP